MKPWLDTWRLWPQHPRERLKLVLGSVLHPRATQAWLRYVRSDALLWQEAAHFPRLITRIYRPYALRRLSCRERVAHMIEHHELLHRLGLRSLLSRSLSQPLTVLTLSGKGGEVAEVRWVALRDGHREGDKHLQFFWNGQWLYSLSFLLREREGQRQLLVTRLQGSKDAQARERIRQATKGLHGCRPSVLLLQLARHFAGRVGCASVRLVSNRQRVALNPMRRLRLKTDLESLWLELGATVQADGLFGLSPQVEVPQDFSAVASNKRAEARRKAEVLRQALQALEACLLQASD